MMGFLDGLVRQYSEPYVNRGFANSGRAYNDMLARFGGQLPPNPTPRPQGGFLSGLMSAAGTHGQAPEEARLSQPRAPQEGSSFLDSLHSGVSENRGMLMGLGTGLLSNGWAGAGQAMGGMQYDEQRRAQAEAEEQAERQQAAMGSLLEQTGVSPEQSQLFMDAGVGGDILSEALRPQERRLETVGENDTLIDPTTGEVIFQGSGASSGSGTIPAEMAGRLAAGQVALENMEAARAALLDPEMSMWDRGQAIAGSHVPAFENDFNAGQRSISLAVESALRMMTGAAAPASEVENYNNMFMPQPTDPLRVREQKFQMLEDFISTARSIAMMGRGGEEALMMMRQRMDAGSAENSGGDVGASAMDAIRRGADPTAVAQRLREAGYDPAQFGINEPPAQAIPAQQMQDYWRAGGA